MLRLKKDNTCITGKPYCKNEFQKNESVYFYWYNNIKIAQSKLAKINHWKADFQLLYPCQKFDLILFSKNKRFIFSHSKRSFQQRSLYAPVAPHLEGPNNWRNVYFPKTSALMYFLCIENHLNLKQWIHTRLN